MSNSMLDLGRSVIAKWGRPARLMAVGVVALLLLIPLQMVESVVRERSGTYHEVVADIAGAWSSDQRLAGPLLVVPFDEKVEVRDRYVTPDGETRTSTRWETSRRRAVLLPSVLSIEARLVPETRSRGIYEVQVFTADVVVSGEFGRLRKAVEGLAPADRLEHIEWSEAAVGFGLSDPRGIVAVDGFRFNDVVKQPRPGTGLGEIVPRGFQLPVGDVISDELRFELPMVIRGSDSLRFLPFGETTTAVISSPWPHPSFNGDVLPAQRTIDATGFEARWTIPLLNRSFPQAWVEGESVEIEDIEAGVRLFEPVALYDLVTRAVKYGLLFVVLTFLTLGLIELVLDVRLSLVQYLLIGVALALFFLILVALAEHLGFAIAYVLAASTVVGLNTLYCTAILRRRSTAAIVGAVLSAIYGMLYVILESEDYALLGGTALLVVALAVTMYFTRRLHEPLREPE